MFLPLSASDIRRTAKNQVQNVILQSCRGLSIAGCKFKGVLWFHGSEI